MMNNNHGILHKIAITVSLFLGITATGVGAKANTNQPTNTTSSNNQQTNHINQSSIQNNKTTLINQQNNVSNKVNSLEQKPKVQTNNSQINNNQSNSQGQSKQSAQKINNRANNLYNHIVSSGINKDIHKFNNPSNNSKVYQTKPKQSLMDAIGAHQIHHHRYNRCGVTITHHRHHKNKIREINHSYHYNHVYKNNVKPINSYRIHHHHNWFRDGLSHRNLRARSWVSMHESGHNWYILSYGHVCVGYFQLNPNYLGYRHGHVDLRPKHQVKVADRYVRGRYGNWVNAKHFWEYHHWY